MAWGKTGDVINDGSKRAVYIRALTLAQRPPWAVSCICIHHQYFDRLSAGGHTEGCLIRYTAFSAAFHSCR